jgi:thiol-disulfide isomerase/thioredoxin
MKTSLKLALASAALILIGQGCPSSPPPFQDLPTVPPGMMDAEDSMMKEDEDEDDDRMMGEDSMMKDEGEEGEETALKPYYIAYTSAQAEAAMREGRGVVLYFWASWCPICRAEEPKIRGWIEGSGLPIAGFRVNYDAETALKAKYRIPYQHTTVFLNADGEEVARFSGPVDEAAFRAALEAAAK